MENIELWINIIISILTGITTCIPLVIKLVQIVKSSVKEKNWAPLMQLVIKLMEEAEANFSTGAERKEYVMDSIEAMKETLNCEIEMEVVSSMIDSIANASKKINKE